jgi:hypothetical protein
MKAQSGNPKEKTEQQVIDQVGRITSKLVDRVAALDTRPRNGSSYSAVTNGDEILVADHRIAGVKRSQVAVVTPASSREAAASYEYSPTATGAERHYTGAFVANPGDKKSTHLGDIATQIPEQTEQHGDKLSLEDGSAIGVTGHTLAAIHESVVQAERHSNS